MPSSLKERPYNAVAHKIYEIENSKTEGLKKARLAQLRRGLGKTIDEVPELWELILEDSSDLEGDSTKIFVVEGAYEEAIYGALTLYGLAHQQNDTPHKKGISFGYAVGKLVTEDESNRDRIGARLKSVLKAKNIFQATTKMRPLISILAKEGESFDFAQLAKDLYGLAAFPNLGKIVRLNWARDYIRGIEEKKNPKSEESKDKGEKDHG